MIKSETIIELIDVVKAYEMGRPKTNLFSKSYEKSPQKIVLKKLNLKILRGEKVGLIGRNGAGKTTLLNLLFQRSKPTGGCVRVGGSIQALMQTGIGFSDELSGRENIRNALIYSEIKAAEFETIEKEIQSFVELGEFLDLPIKSYSLGMRARLEFAVATAIRPDILLIDEVLGAGDGYFVNKCNQRMQTLIADTTLILVSHSLEQIIKYCDRCIWIEDGEIRADGPAKNIVTEYQMFMDSCAPKGELTAVIEQEEDDREDSNNTSNFQKNIVEKLPVKLMRLEKTLEVEFDYNDGFRMIIETGDQIDLEFYAKSNHFVRPGVIGFDQQDNLVFCLYSPIQISPAEAEKFGMIVDKMEIGVGEYFCLPILLSLDDKKILALGSKVLRLKCTETNYSDPPIVHLDGVWIEENSQEKYMARVSAWV